MERKRALERLAEALDRYVETSRRGTGYLGDYAPIRPGHYVYEAVCAAERLFGGELPRGAARAAWYGLLDACRKGDDCAPGYRAADLADWARSACADAGMTRADAARLLADLTETRLSTNLSRISRDLAAGRLTEPLAPAAIAYRAVAILKRRPRPRPARTFGKLTCPECGGRTDRFPHRQAVCRQCFLRRTVPEAL
ncbi:MAG: hypothetical protein AMXMBFR83_16400 [Phycisphaerae bacterium]